MRVLVTGASGFIGRHVIPALQERGVDVVGCRRSKSRSSSIDITCRLADLMDRSSIRDLLADVKPTHILHLAWTVEHGKFWNDPANLDWVRATLDLAKFGVEAGVIRFVGTGTCFEYDWPQNGNCSEIATPTRSHTLYDTAKDATHRVLASYFNQMGCSFAWARIFFPFGEGEPPERLVPSVSRALALGLPAQCTNGTATRDFLDVRDTGAALAAITLSSVGGPINVASGSALRIRDVAMRLGELAGRPDLIQLGALPDRPNDPPRIVADVTRLEHEVGHVARLRLDDSLRSSLKYWKEAAE